MSTTVDDVDLEALALALDEGVPTHLREGYLTGKTALRDAVVARLDCSEAVAEGLVDTLEARGIICFDEDPERAEGAGLWLLAPSARR
jgi:hypothetical protein